MTCSTGVVTSSDSAIPTLAQLRKIKEMTASLVSRRDAIDAAFCRAARTTLSGRSRRPPEEAFQKE